MDLPSQLSFLLPGALHSYPMPWRHRILMSMCNLCVFCRCLGLTLPYRPYADWLDFVLAQPELPLAISTSYGDDEQTGMYPLGLSVTTVSNWTTVPLSFAQRVCAGFAQLGAVMFRLLFWVKFLKMRMPGARGISIMFSSGDSGVGDGDSNPATQQCLSNNGSDATVFIPEFPASCVKFIIVPVMIIFWHLVIHPTRCP